MNINAEIYLIREIEQVSPTFKKRSFVVKHAENPMYPQFIEMQMLQDRTTELDKFKPKDQVSITFDIKGREWKSPTGEVKYFNSLDAWKIAPADGQSSSSSAPTAAIQTDPTADDTPF